MPGYEVFGEEERQAINSLFDANGGVLFAHGFEGIRKGVYKVREFEGAMAEHIGCAYAQAVSSGSSALLVAIKSLGIGDGDEVIIPAFTYVATAEAVLQAGAKLVIVDIDDTYTLDPTAFEAAITPKTRAVIPVHMMGAPADMDRIVKIARGHQLKVIEDSAQAVGGSFHGRRLGTIGDLGCFSFDAGKVLNTGEGGMVLTNSESYFTAARAYHDHGHEYSERVSRGQEGAIGVGFNFRMTELQGCIGLVQLSKLEQIINAQRKNKAALKARLIASEKTWVFRRILDEGEIGDSILFRLPDRRVTDEFVLRMKSVGLSTKNVPDAMRWHFAKHWGHMFNRHAMYEKVYLDRWAQSAELLETTIAVPVMVKMDTKKIDDIAEKLITIAGELGL